MHITDRAVLIGLTTQTAEPIHWEPDADMPHLLVQGRDDVHRHEYIRSLALLCDQPFYLSPCKPGELLSADAIRTITAGSTNPVVLLDDPNVIEAPTGDAQHEALATALSDLAGEVTFVIGLRDPDLHAIPSSVLSHSGRIVLGHANLLDRVLMLREPDRIDTPDATDADHEVAVAELTTYRGILAV